MGRFHTNWLNMMYPRLRLAHNLLTDDGVIFISIDNNEVFNLKKVCDEVFGEENFINCVSVASNPRGRQSDTFIASVNDYLLVYAKDIMRCIVNGAPLTEEQKSEYKYTDPDGKNYRLLGLRQRGVASRRVDRPDMYFPIYVDKDTKEIRMNDNGNSYEVLPHKSDGSDGRWMWGKEKCKNDIHLLVPRLIESRNEYDIFVKDYLNRGGEERTRKFTSIWDNKLYNNNTYKNGKIPLVFYNQDVAKRFWTIADEKLNFLFDPIEMVDHSVESYRSWIKFDGEYTVFYDEPTKKMRSYNSKGELLGDLNVENLSTGYIENGVILLVSGGANSKKYHYYNVDFTPLF